MSGISTHLDFTLLAVQKCGSLDQEYDESRCVCLRAALAEVCRETKGQVAGNLVRDAFGTP